MSAKKLRRSSVKASIGFSTELIEDSSEPPKTPDTKKSVQNDKEESKQPTPIRRSARLRGAPVEFSGGEIEEMARSTRSRSRSKSATPSRIIPGLVESNMLSLETINESPPAKKKTEAEQPESAKQRTRQASKYKQSSTKKGSPLQSAGMVLELSPEVATVPKSPIKIDFSQAKAQEDSENKVQLANPTKKKSLTHKQPSQPSTPATSSSGRNRRSSKASLCPIIDLTSPTSPKEPGEFINSLKVVEELQSRSSTKSKKSLSPVKHSPQKRESPACTVQETPQQPVLISPKANSLKVRTGRESGTPASPVCSSLQPCYDTPPVEKVAYKPRLYNTPTATEVNKSPKSIFKKGRDEEEIKASLTNITPSKEDKKQANESDLNDNSLLKTPTDVSLMDKNSDIEEFLLNESAKSSPRKNNLAESIFKSPEKILAKSSDKSLSKSPQEVDNQSAKSTPASKKKVSTSTALEITPPTLKKTIETPTFKLLDPLKETVGHACDISSNKWPEIANAEELFSNKEKLKPAFLDQIKSLYDQTNVQEGKDLPEQLVGPHQEVIWQQITRKNKKCMKSFKKAKEDLEEALDFNFNGHEKTDKIEQEQPTSELEDDEDVMDEEMDDEENEDEEQELDEEDGADLFNLKESDLKDLDEKMEELAEEKDDDEQGQTKAEKKAKRKRKTRTEYEEEILDEETVQNQRKKRFKPSSVDDQFFNLNEMNQFLQEQDKVEEKRKLGKFDGAEEMTELMEVLEEENLQPRSWDLAGEVTAGERGKDELLDHFIDVDFRAKSAPIITTDTTAVLEALILKRIKDKSFDDVVRKKRQNESLIPMSNRHHKDMEDEVRKSLAEVYENDFKDKQKEDQAEELIEPQLDPEVAAINKDLNVLFKKLDALSHCQFTPQEIAPEIKIVNNMASFRAEEVGPMASTQPDAELLAPEEVFKRVKSVPKAKDERTETDRKRERRNKKKKQKVLAAKGLMNGGEGNSSTSIENNQTEVVRGLEKTAEKRANAKVFKKKKSVYSKRKNKDKKHVAEN